jgi:hypothetical protein
VSVEWQHVLIETEVLCPPRSYLASLWVVAGQLLKSIPELDILCFFLSLFLGITLLKQC